MLKQLTLKAAFLLGLLLAAEKSAYPCAGGCQSVTAMGRGRDRTMAEGLARQNADSHCCNGVIPDSVTVDQCVRIPGNDVCTVTGRCMPDSSNPSEDFSCVGGTPPPDLWPTRSDEADSDSAISNPWLDAPCTQNAKSQRCELGLRSCNVALKNSGKEGMLDQLDRLIRTKIEWYYKGHDVDLYKTVLSDSSTGAGASVVSNSFPLPVCNLLENEVDQHPASSSHPSPVTHCGKYMEYSNGVLKANEGNATRETAYMRGGIIQALKCFKQQVANEINTQKKLNAEACETGAKDLSALAKLTQDTATFAKSNSDELSSLCKQAEMSSSQFCDEDFIAQLNESGQLTQAKHMQAVCYLSSARQQLEAAFTRLAYCEVVQRTRRSWRNHIDFIQQEINRKVVKPCKDRTMDGRCKKKFGIGFISFKWTDAGCVEKEFNQCYQGAGGAGLGYHHHLKEILKGLYPDDGSCK